MDNIGNKEADERAYFISISFVYDEMGASRKEYLDPH